MWKSLSLLCLVFSLVLFVGCGSTEIIESPKTAFVPENVEVPPPKVIWSSRTLPQKFDYLGKINVRSITYDGALTRLVDAGHKLRADAVIDVQYEAVGFLTTFSAFAVKFKE